MRKVKGSTIILTFMYVTWVAYIFLSVWCKGYTGEFFPQEVTFGTAALFIAETVSLARLKMFKEGSPVLPKHSNQFLESIGVTRSEFEDEIERLQNEGDHSL